MRQKGTELMFENCFVVGRNGIMIQPWILNLIVSIT